MTADEFKGLALEEQVSYVNEHLKQGLSLRKIFEDLNLNRIVETRRIEKSGYKYDKATRQYYSSNIQVINPEHESNTTVTESEYKSITPVTDEEHKSITEVSQKKHKSNTAVIPQGIDWETLLEMIERYKQGSLSGETRTLIIDRKEFKGNICAKTMKLYTGVLADFQDFANEYSQYSFQDLHNMALVEFMKSYGKRS